MTIQDFRIYTRNGYAGDLVDSGPKVSQTGILNTGKAGFGLAMSRDTSIERGCSLGTASTTIYAISMREYNHEADTRPAKDGDWYYLEGGSVSLLRQGYLYITLTGTTAVTAGDLLNVVAATGEFTADAANGSTILACDNVTADLSSPAGEVIKARIDIIA